MQFPLLLPRRCAGWATGRSRHLGTLARRRVGCCARSTERLDRAIRTRRRALHSPLPFHAGRVLCSLLTAMSRRSRSPLTVPPSLRRAGGANCTSWTFGGRDELGPMGRSAHGPSEIPIPSDRRLTENVGSDDVPILVDFGGTTRASRNGVTSVALVSGSDLMLKGRERWQR